MSNIISMPSELEQRISDAAELLNGEKRVRVISHYDADGISSAAVLCGMLERASKPFHATMARSLDRSLIERIRKEKNGLVIFADMGSGQLDIIDELETKTIVLDHHKVKDDSTEAVHVNPSIWGINGTTDVSGATTSFLLAQFVDESNWDLSQCALAGAFGDMQHLGGYKGLNLQILEKGVEKGLLSEKRMLSLQGQSLLDAAGGSAEPFFKGYSGREDLVSDLCSQIGVDPRKGLDQYSESEARRVVSVLMLILASSGCDYENMSQLVSIQHIGTRSGISISEMASLANACGRSERYSVGLAMELGDSSALTESRALRKEYNRRVLDRLISLEEGVEQKRNIQCFRSDDSSLAGALSGLYMAFIGDKAKPTVAYSLSDKNYRISARGTKKLVSRGLDLAEGLSVAASKVGGVGGGHVIASGATVPRDMLSRFLDELDEITGRQLSA